MVIYSSDGTPIISIKVDDTSYKYEEIMGDCNVFLEFALTEHVEIEVGSYILFQGVKYEMMSRESVSIKHNRNYEYKATFSGPQARFGRYVMYNTIDGRLRYDMIGKPLDHLTMVVANLNMRESGTWSIGDYVDKTEALVSYNHTSVKDALNAIAEAFDTEWSVEPSGNGFVINLRKNEFNKDNPVTLGYGKNQGFKPGVGRFNFGEFGQVEKVWIDGGERNLSIGEYGFTTLHFPRSLAFQIDANGKFKYTVNGTTRTQTGFDSSTALSFVTDEWGASVRLASAAENCIEASLDLTNYYPKRVGTVTGVHYIYKNEYLSFAEISAMQNVNWEEVQVDIDDSTIGTAEGSLDYSKCLFANDDPLTVIFQDGMLAGREFDATFVKAARTSGGSVVRPANRFELVRATIDGVDMPNANFRPNAGQTQDKYIVVNCYLPEEYICDFANFEGAELEALREACKFIRENKDPQFTFKGTVDDLYAKRNWLNLGGKLILGGCISFQDDKIQPQPIVTRIVGVKTLVNNPYSPEVTLSNETVKGGMASMIAKLRGDDEHVVERVNEARRMAKRSFRDAKETIGMLQGALDYFSEGIHPITVETMSLLVGDASLQFKVWTNRNCTTAVPNPVSYDPDSHTVVVPACVVQHMTLGINDVRPSQSRSVSEYLRWSMTAFESAPLTGVDQQGNDLSATAFYLYAKVDADNVAKADSSMTPTEASHIYGSFVLSKTKKDIGPITESGNHYYYLLVGILNSEFEGDRSFAPMYGFTEVLPGQITTDVIRSASGDSYFDLANNSFALGDKLTFLNGLLRLKGSLIVSGSGEAVPIGSYCGEYDATRTYAAGDEVTATVDGETSTYRYVYSVPSSGHPVTDAQYWTVVAKGASGGSGPSGINTAVVRLYKRASSAPSRPTASLTYTFATGVLSGSGSNPLAGWSQSVPASDGNPLYVTAATAASREDTDTIAANEWASPVILVEDGDNGLNTATVMLYKRASSTPSAPSVTLTYTFATGALTGSGTNPLNGWTKDIPTGSNVCYVIQATAISDGPTDDIAASEWSAPVKAFKDGTDGARGTGIEGVNIKYGVSQDSNPPTTWVATMPEVGPGVWVWIWERTYYSDGTYADKYSKVLSGGTAPASPYRGLYKADTLYYGSLERTDIVKYVASGNDHSLDGYYRANPLAYAHESPNQGSPFRGIAPGNTDYWLPFQGQFENLATGLAFIEQLIVQRLNTAGEGVNTGKRIVIEGNKLVMYDGVNDTEPRLLITGDDLSEAHASEYFNFPSNQYAMDYINRQYRGTGLRVEQKSSGVTFNVSGDGAILSVPDMLIDLSAGLNSYNGSQTGFVTFDLYWELDGEYVTGDGSYDGEFGYVGSYQNKQYNAEISFDGFTIPISAGQHTLKLCAEMWASGCVDTESNLVFVAYASPHTNYNNIPISYPQQKTEVGANGFQVSFGSEQLFKCLISGSTTTFLMQSNRVGIELSSSGSGTGTMRIRLGGTWYNATRNGSGYLVLST